MNISNRELQGQDQERRRVARELHDTVGQSLASLTINLQILAEFAPAMSQRGRRALQESVGLVDQCLSETRSLAYLLHPPDLERLGLVEALKWFIAGYTDRSQIHVNVQVPQDLGRLAPEVELTIYRIVQESLVNVQQHSRSAIAPRSIFRKHLRLNGPLHVLMDPRPGFSSSTSALRRIPDNAARRHSIALSGQIGQ